MPMPMKTNWKKIHADVGELSVLSESKYDPMGGCVFSRSFFDSLDSDDPYALMFSVMKSGFNQVSASIHWSDKIPRTDEYNAFIQKATERGLLEDSVYARNSPKILVNLTEANKIKEFVELFGEYVDIESLKPELNAIYKELAKVSENQPVEQKEIAAKTSIDDKLFAHIHNDTWLSGTKLQGKTFADTTALFTSYVDTMSIPEKTEELKALSEDLKYLKAIDSDINSNKNIAEISERIAQKILRKERVLMPGGWTGTLGIAEEPGEPGHALIYCFETNEAGQLLFKIYNSGAGLKFHKIISEVDKERYCTVQQFCIDNITGQENHQEKLAWFLTELIKPQERDKTQSYNENILYQKIFPKIAYLDGELIAPPEGELTLTAGQRSGTCAEKVLHQLAKIAHTDKKAYKRFMYNFKKHTLDIYIKQVTTEGRDKEPIVQEQIQLAIDNMARLLDKADYFSTEEKNKEYQYLSEKKSVFSQKKPVTKDTALFNENSFNTFRSQSDLFSKPLEVSDKSAFGLEESKSQAENLVTIHTGSTPLALSESPPKNVEAWESFLAETKTLVESNPELAIARLETFFLKLPIPLQYDEKTKENVLETLTALYKIYIETYPKFSQVITPRNIVCALSFITACSQIAKMENILNEPIHKLLEQEQYNPFMGSQEVLCDTRLQELRNRYKQSANIQVSDMMEKYYIQIIKDAGLYDNFISIYNKIPADKKLKVSYLREDKNKQALCILSYVLSYKQEIYLHDCEYGKIEELRKKCAWQNKLERSICAGLAGLNTKKNNTPEINWGQAFSVFKEETSSVASNLLKSLENDTLETPLRSTRVLRLEKLAINEPLAIGEGVLYAFAHRKDMLTTNEIQIGNVYLSSQTNQSITDILKAKNDKTWIARELIHLRTSKKAQLKSTLVFFLENLSLLAEEDIQYYLEKNIFEPNLLMDKLSKSPDFLQELHNFLIESSHKFSPKNQPDKTAVFLLHLAIKVNFYADEMSVKGAEENLKLIQTQLDSWLKRETSDVLVLRELHRARILLMANVLQRRSPASLTEAEIQQYLESLLIYHHYPLVREYQDGLDTRKFKEAIALLKNHIPQVLEPALKKNMEPFLIKLLGNVVANGTFEFQGRYVFIKNKAGELCFKVDFNTGDIYDNQDLTYKLIPETLKANSKFSRFFSEDVKYIWQDSSEKIYKLEQPKGVFYRITKLATSVMVTDTNNLIIEKKIGDPGSWFRNIEPPLEFPKTITNSHRFWADQEKIYASEISTNKITHCYNTTTNTITLIDTQYVLLNQQSYLHDMFSAFEDKSFIEVYKNNTEEEPKFIVRFPRYNFELFARENAKKSPSWEFIHKDTGEELVLNEVDALMPGVKAQLRFRHIEKSKEKEETRELQEIKEAHEKKKKKKLKETLIIPRQQFFFKEHKNTDEHSFDLDIADTIRDTWLKHAKVSDRHYNNLENFISYTVEKDKILPSSMEDGLYLVYTYLCNKNPDKALEMLTYLHERFGGLKGTVKELETIRWIINSTPAFLKKKQQEATLENPKVFSIKLKTLSFLTSFNRDHPGFKWPERNTSQDVDVEAYQTHTQSENETFFKDLPKEIFKIYEKYHHGKSNISTEFALSTSEKLVLLRTCFMPKVGKAAGSLQLEWRKLEREQLLLEMNNLKNKPIKTEDDIKRLQDITELLAKQKKITKHTSKLKKENTAFQVPEKFALDSAMVSPELLSDVAEKFQALIVSKKPFTEAQLNSSYGIIPIQYLDSKKFQDYIETFTSERTEKLISLPTDEKLWIESFYGLCYKISRGNLTLSETEKLKKFCVDTIKAYRYESAENSGNLSQLCKALFVVLNNPVHFQGCELKGLKVDSSDKIFTQTTLNTWFNTIFSEAKKLCPDGIMVSYNEQRKQESRYEASEINWDKIIDLAREPYPVLSEEVAPLAPFNFSENLDLKDFYQAYYNIEQELNKEIGLLDLSETKEAKESYQDKRDFANKLDENIGRLQNEYALKKQTYAVQNLGLLEARAVIAGRLKIERKRLKTDLETSLDIILQIANSGVNEDLSVLGGHKHLFTKDNFKMVLLRLYMKNDINAYQEATGLNKEEILKLHNATTQYLWLAQKEQQCKRIKKKLKKIPKLDITEKSSKTLKATVFNLVQEMTEKNIIDPQRDQVLMVFQYASKMLIREKQKKILDLLRENAKREYESKIIQLIMGGGKTKVLLPILALKKATGTNLSVIEVPDALFETNYKDLNNVSESLFGQTAYKFIFDRNAPCDALSLKRHYKNFNQVMLSRGYVITTNNSVKSLMMKYAELLEEGPQNNQEEWKKQIKWLSRILKFYKTKADGLIDEVDSSLDIRTQFNYTIGETKNVTAEQIKELLPIHQFVNKLHLDVTDPKDREKIAEAFINNRGKENPLASYLDYIESTIKDTEDLKKNLKKPMVDYLLNKGKSIPSEINELKDEKGKAIFALAKYHLSVLLPYAATQKLYENFGPSQDEKKTPAEKAVAIPYEGNDQPRESYKFGNYLETINYTIHANLETGISRALFNKVLKEQLEHASNELRNSVGVFNIDETQTGKIFNQFLQQADPKLKLSELELQDTKQLEALYKTLSKNQDLVYFCLENYILPTIKIEPLMLSSDPHNHVGLYRSVQGVTGTPWNTGALHQSLSFDQKQSLGTDGITVDLLKRANVHVVDSETPAEFLENAFKKTTSPENVRALIDIGARFRGITNEKAAEIISDFCTKKGSVLENKIKFVLFFKKNAQGKDELYALDTKSKEVKYIGSSDKKIIKACLGCKPSERFTYYDQTHCIGTDVLQDNKAKAIVTVSKDTLKKDLLQGVMRMRGLAIAQKVEVFVSSDIKESLGIVNIDSIIELTTKNQTKRVLEDHFRSTLQKMHNVAREAVLKSILEMDDKDAMLKKACFDSVKKLFILEQSKDLFDLYGQIEKERKIIKIFKELEQNLLLKIDNISLPEEKISELKIKLEADFKTLIEDAVLKCPEKVFYTKAPLFGQAVQTQQATQQQKQQAQQQAQQQQAQQQALPQRYGVSGVVFDPWMRELSFEKFMGMQLQNTTNDVKNLNDIYTNDYHSKPSLQFYPTIFASVNAYKTCDYNYYPEYSKAVHAVLMRETASGDIESVIITYPEIDEFANVLNDPNNGHPHHVWVVSSSGKVLDGKKPEKKPENYDKILTQIQFFNGDFLALGKQATLDHWLLEHQKAGFDFFEKNTKPFRNIEQWQIDALKNRLQDIDKAYHFVLEKHTRDRLVIGWEKQFTHCTATDLEAVKIFEEFIVSLKQDLKELAEFNFKYAPFCTYRYLDMITKNKDDDLASSFIRYLSKERHLLKTIIEEALNNENYNLLEKICTMVLPIDEDFHDYLMKKIAFKTYNKEAVKPSLDVLFSKINRLQGNDEKIRFYEGVFAEAFFERDRDTSWVQLSVFFENVPEAYIKIILSNTSNQRELVDKIKKLYHVDSETFFNLAQYLPKDVFLSLLDSDKTINSVVLGSLSGISDPKSLKRIIDVIGLEKYLTLMKEPQNRFTDVISCMLSSKESAKELLEIFGDQKDKLLEIYGFEAAKKALNYGNDFKNVLNMLPKEPINIQEKVFFEVILKEHRFDVQSRLEKFEYYAKEWSEEKVLAWMQKNPNDWYNAIGKVDTPLSELLLFYFKKSEANLKPEQRQPISFDSSWYSRPWYMSMDETTGKIAQEFMRIETKRHIDKALREKQFEHVNQALSKRNPQEMDDFLVDISLEDFQCLLALACEERTSVLADNFLNSSIGKHYLQTPEAQKDYILSEIAMPQNKFVTKLKSHGLQLNFDKLLELKLEKEQAEKIATAFNKMLMNAMENYTDSRFDKVKKENALNTLKSCLNSDYFQTHVNQESALKLCAQLERLNQLDEEEKLFYQTYESKINSALQYYFKNNEADVRQMLKTMIADSRISDLIVLMKVLSRFEMDFVSPEDFLMILKKNFKRDELLSMNPNLSVQSIILSLKNNDFLFSKQLLENLASLGFSKEINDNIKVYLNRNKKAIVQNLLLLMNQTQKPNEAKEILMYYFDLEPELLNFRVLESLGKYWDKKETNVLFEKHFDVIKRSCVDEDKRDYVDLYRKLSTMNTELSKSILLKESAQLDIFWSDAIEAGDLGMLDTINQLLYDTADKFNNHFIEYLQKKYQDANIFEFLCKLVKQNLNFNVDSRHPRYRQMKEMAENMQKIVLEKYPQSREDVCLQMIAATMEGKEHKEETENKDNIENARVFRELCNAYIVDTSPPVSTEETSVKTTAADDDDGFGTATSFYDDGLGGFDFTPEHRNYILPLKVLTALSAHWPDQHIKDFVHQLSYPINYNQAETLAENTTQTDFLKLYTFCFYNNIDTTALVLVAEKRWSEITEQLRVIEAEKQESDSKRVLTSEPPYFEVVSDDLFVDTEENPAPVSPMVSFQYRPPTPTTPNSPLSNPSQQETEQEKTEKDKAAEAAKPATLPSKKSEL